MKSVYYFLKTLNISIYEPLIIAVSYGPDSMALLDVISKTYPHNKVICAHVHHNHRKESDNEYEELKEYCDGHNLIFEFMKIDSYKNNKFTEEEARNKRYEFFDKLVEKYNSKYLFTAHHGDDLIETVLMRITRGSTLKGYSGISLINNRKNYNLVRPFLYVTKDEILNYCENKKLPYAVDKSNFDSKYTRNRYRKNILPCFKQENPFVHKQFLKFSTVLNEYDNYFNNLVNKIYPTIVIENVIDVSSLLKYDDLIIKRIVMQYLYNNYENDINNINNDNTDLILSLIKSDKPNGEVNLPNRKTLVKSYNKIYFAGRIDYNEYCFVFDGYEVLSNGFVIKRIDNLENTTNYVTAIDSKDVSFPLYIRNVIAGDKIEVLGLNGTKKVNDIFINEKIPRYIRGTYPVLVDSKGTLLWLPGLKKSKYDKSKHGKYDIILKYYKEEKNDKSK